MIAKILEENIVRSNSLLKWESPPLIDYEYWDVRYEIPERIKDPLELISYIAKKYGKVDVSKIKQKDIFSFYFWIRDELNQILETEIAHLTPMKTGVSDRKFQPSQRAKDFPALMELYNLAGKDLRLWNMYKKEKYSTVFEILLAMTIESEGSYKLTSN